MILREDLTLRLGAAHGFSREATERMHARFPVSLDADLPSGEVIRSAQVVHLPDAQASRFGAWAQSFGFRSYVSVPMLKDGWAIGAIAIGREQAGAFSDRQIQLLTIFAAQAVIAIQNAVSRSQPGTVSHRGPRAADGNSGPRCPSSLPTDVQPGSTRSSRVRYPKTAKSGVPVRR